jgi:4-amino-4-deoxy-L-arabinose transferase-like glycosyltransferase
MKSQKFYIVLFVCLLLISAGRIISTYSVFSLTSDEGYHIAAGMEWLDRGTYTYEYHHPPLARVAVALGPYLDGSRSMGNPVQWREGEDIVYAKGLHSRTLALARLGTLPFFLLSAILVWLWSSRLFGRPTALAAVLLFTTLPPILAHSGLATTDVALTATLSAVLYVFIEWIDAPTLSKSLYLGLATGLAVLSKFSVFLFLPVCVIATVAVRYRATKRVGIGSGRPARDIFRFLAVAAAAVFIVVWGGYRFHLTPLSKMRPQRYVNVSQFAPAGSLRADIYYKIKNIPLPLPEVLYGVIAISEHNREGHDGYLFGEIRRYGWWYFFPVTLFVKTPLAFLFLAAIGTFAVARRFRKEHEWKKAVPAVCAFAILLSSLPSNINVGLRHILVIYPFLSILAGRGVIALVRSNRLRYTGSAIAFSLIAWQVVSGIAHHPDYLAYFNEFGGKHPERILVNADLDWGQDAYRLREKIRQMGISEISVAIKYFYTDYQYALFSNGPNSTVKLLEPGKPTVGWIAISLGTLYRDKGYDWLKLYTPDVKVGKSIYLYHIENLYSGL